MVNILKNKKAFMKTVEVILAVIVTFAFVISIIPETVNTNANNYNDLLTGLENNLEFRNCVIDEDDSCINNVIASSLIGYYNYTYRLYSDPFNEPDVNLPQKKVDTYSIIISGNHSFYNPKIFKLYYWIK